MRAKLNYRVFIADTMKKKAVKINFRVWHKIAGLFSTFYEPLTAAAAVRGS